MLFADRPNIAQRKDSILEPRLKKVEANVFVMHDLVALARGFYQPRMILDGDMSTRKGDQARFLQNAGSNCDRAAARA